MSPPESSLDASLSVFNSERGKFTGIRFPPTASLSCFQADRDGQAGSEGRRRPAFALAKRRRGKIGMSAADPIAFRNDLLFMNRPRKLYFSPHSDQRN